MATEADKITFIETHPSSKSDPEPMQAFYLLQKAVDLDAPTQTKLSLHLHKYLSEDNKTSHIVAALHCVYVFRNKAPFKEAFLHLGKSKRQQVRLAVAMHLSNFGIWDDLKEDFFGDEEIINLAIALTADESPSVRDCAVFQFNNGLANDSVAIRKALYDRVNDTNLAVRQEAIAALTARGEIKYYPLIKQKLNRIDVAPVWIDAARRSGYKAFQPDLEKLLLKRQKSPLYQDDTSVDEIKEAIASLS